MISSMSWTRILNDAEDSPLVDDNNKVSDKNQFDNVLTVTYSF